MPVDFSFFKNYLLPIDTGKIKPFKTDKVLKIDKVNSEYIPSKVVLYLKNKHNLFDYICVCVGEEVKKGQIIAKNLLYAHALYSTFDGSILEINKDNIVIKPTSSINDDTNCLCFNPLVNDPNDLNEFYNLLYNKNITREELINNITKSGLVGLGGGAFPTFLKIVPNIKYIIINIVECEPYLSADNTLTQNYVDDIIKGILILNRILFPYKCVIAINNQYKLSIKKVKNALEKYKFNNCIEITHISGTYPHGSDKQLIKTIFNYEIPKNSHPSQDGYVCFNVGTVLSIYKAICFGEPLIKRLSTIYNKNTNESYNVWLPFGIPIKEFLKNAMGFRDTKPIWLGGLMMGNPLEDEAYFTPSMSSILLSSEKKIEETPCINCGLCIDVCPVKLQPQTLLLYSKTPLKQNNEKLKEYGLTSCIECNACTYVCPSEINLVSYYKDAKKRYNHDIEKINRSNLSKIRHEEKIARLKQEEKTRLERREKLKIISNPKQDKVENTLTNTTQNKQFSEQEKKKKSKIILSIRLLENSLKRAIENNDQDNINNMKKSIKSLEKQIK